MAAPETTLEQRQRFLKRAAYFTPLVAVDSNETRYIASTADHHITRALFLKAARGDMKLLHRALKVLETTGNWGRDDGTFVEAGANIGTTTVTAVETQQFARAVVCEPEPQNLLLLELNVVANGLEREVKILPVAAGDADREVELLIAPGKSGLHEIHAEGIVRPAWDGTSMRVKQVTFDTLGSEGAFDPEAVTMLWMDVQGHETHILRGASVLTERGVPVVMELDPEALARHGGLDLLREVASESYTHYVSMRRIRSGAEPQFDLDPVHKLDEEIRWLVDHDRFTDILLVRDPVRRPERGGLPLLDKERRRAGLDKGRAKPPALSGGSQKERRAFAREAQEYTPLVAAELDGATVLLRTHDAADADLFVARTDGRLHALERALSALDEQELGAAARSRPFLDLQAGTGIVAVAAVRTHGFESAVACEGELDAYTLLKLNVALNRLGARAVAAALPDADGLTIDALVRRGTLPADPGLVWAEDAEALLAGAEDLLASGPPLVVPHGAAGLDTLGYASAADLDGRVLLLR